SWLGEEGPRQRVEAALRPDFETVSAPGWSAARVSEHLAREAGLPFDLEAGPPARWRLLVHSPAESSLLLAVHHMVCDLWSIVVLFRDLEVLYLQRTGGRETLPAPLPVTPAEPVALEESRLRAEEGRLRAFWEEHLALPLPVLDLPTDRPRPAFQSFRGASAPLRLPAAATAELRRLARESDTTLFVVALALFTALIHRASAQDDVVVGVPVSGRTSARFAGVVGYFVNPLALRARFAEGTTFAAHLAALRETALGALSHQDYPFARLAERLQPVRDPSRSPVFQAMLTLQRAHLRGLEGLAAFALGEGGERLEWGGLDLESVRLPGRPIPVDVNLALAERDDALRGSLQFAADLYDEVTVRRWLRHFAVLARGAASRPGTPIDSLPWLEEAERIQLLVEWNDGTVGPPAGEPVHRLIEGQVRRTADRVAVTCRGTSLTYRELNARANQLARHLRSLGLAREARVGVCLDRSVDLVVSLLGILKAGGAYVPLDPTYPRPRIDLVLDDAGVDILLTESRRAALFGMLGAVLVHPDLEGAAIRGQGREDLPADLDAPASLAYVIYTSGSTGRPKGVMVPHRAVANFFLAMDRRLGEEPGTWLAATSPSFDISVLELLWTLSRGYRVVVRVSEARIAPAVRTTRSTVDLSLFFFASEEGLAGPGPGKYRFLLEAARQADGLGFSAVWTPERHFHEFGGPFPNPSVTAAALAAITERVGIRAGSVVLPLHHPVRVAEEWSVVDNLSGGRVGLAFASGWNAADFVFAPDRFAERKAVMREQIDMVRRLWRGEAVRLPGGRGEVEVRTLPRPVQPELPFWITAAGSAETFVLAGELGANLLTHLLGQSLRDVAEQIARYRQARRSAGHPGRGQVALMLHTFVGESEERVRDVVREPLIRYLATSLDLMKVLASGQDLGALDAEDRQALLERAFDRYFLTSGLFGTVESCRERLAELQAAGVDEVACLLDFGVDVDTMLESLDRLAATREAPLGAEAAAGEEAVPQQLLRHAVTHFQCTPSAMASLVEDAELAEALGGLHRLLLGGEALTLQLAQRTAEPLAGSLLNMYGPTETTVWSATDRYEPAEALVTLGRPVANTTLHVVDRRGDLVPVGQPGELLIGGEGVVRGYWRRPDWTAERFIPDSFSAGPG
ncbi:MAG TPA: MupA/Atu3671 family FMN-dependent luciferase-like monooxygenase, partial [Thermoanaerobaculia bacterium]|nr:MupA/Atu3671 family FMN-dependent luciferase-like monooxygenase [Thermoanaerobaculia bacterium]